MKCLSLIVLILNLTISIPATAEDANGRAAHIGNAPCQQWVSNRKEDEIKFLFNAAWISGYFSAFNRQTPNTYNIMGNTDMENVYLRMDIFCENNPSLDLDTGMRAITLDLWPNRKRIDD